MDDTAETLREILRFMRMNTVYTGVAAACAILSLPLSVIAIVLALR